jgi:carbamoylphosphate synthase large subunit
MTKQIRLLQDIHILTTDAEKRIGLYAIRYLGRAGALVSGIARDDGVNIPIGFLSRYIHTKINLGKEHFLEDLKKFLKRRASDFQIINPIDISQMLCVIDADKEHHLGCTYLLPGRESLVTADNKELLVKHAQQARLRCPRTFYRLSPAELRELCRGEVTFPCIIKFRGDNRETHWRPEERYSIVYSPRELVSEYERMHAIEPYPVLQEYIEGKGFGYFALYDRKRALKAQFCHRRIREYPTHGGPSSCCESIHDPELVRIGRRLLESLEWTGLAMVEFKFDEVRKQYFIIEVNPRYWGSLPLAVNSGVNFPVLHILSALDWDYDPVLEYRLGVKVRFFERDLKALMALARLEESLTKKIRLLLQIFNPAIKDGFVSLDDMGPLLGILHLKRSGRSRDVKL